jgi:RimJ/RimL family protein N-acetyltransferase
MRDPRSASIRVAERLGMTWAARERTTFKEARCVELTYERWLDPS